MRYGSVCSGIEAATAAWHPLGWEPAFFSEIEQSPCQTSADRHAVAYGCSGDLTANDSVMQPVMAVRRLTPIECERLQGFPDRYTEIPYRNKPADQCPDGPRYKALGNSKAVPVMAWIGQRIQMLEDIEHDEMENSQ